MRPIALGTAHNWTQCNEDEEDDAHADLMFLISEQEKSEEEVRARGSSKGCTHRHAHTHTCTHTYIRTYIDTYVHG